VGDDGQKVYEPRAGWRRRVIVALGIFCALLLIFHRPLLLSLGHRIALHYAAKENLKLDFRIEGSVFTNLTVRNLHAVATGPSDVESIDVDLARANYGLLAPLRHGLNSIRNLEVRSARIVLNPAKAPLRPRPPNPKKKIDLPDFFPERLHVTDATIIVRNKPHDFVIEHVDLDLDPRNPGELKIDKLQLVGGQTWLKISAQTSYANRNLILRDVVLANDERIRVLSVDASNIAARKLAINFDYPVGGGNLSGSLALREAQTSLETDVHLRVENVPAGIINKYAALPESWISGQIERLDVDLRGLLSSPRTWNGTIAAQVRDFKQEATSFDRGVLQVSAQNGVATLQTADIVQGENKFQVRGSTELPAEVKQLGRQSAKFEIAATAPDLKRLTAGMPEKLSGSAQVNGKVDINNGKLGTDLNISAAALAFEDGSIEKLNAMVKATKTLASADSNKPWFADLRSDTAVVVTNLRFRDYVADSAEATLRGVDDLVTIERATVRRKQNEFAVHGDYRLPKDFRDAVAQPAKIEMSLNAIELGDYWIEHAADRITGPLRIDGQIEWRNGVGNGQLSIYGADLRMRDLVFRQVNAQCTVAENVVYLNDFTANLNERDYVNANAIVDLRAPFHYSGKISANIADLSSLKPLLRNQNELTGSLVIDWEGSGDAIKFENSGKLKLALNNGRYGDLQSLQATVDATYSPNGLDVPTIFLRSDRMDFQAIVQAKGDTLEITKIQLDQGQAKYASGYISIPFIWKNLGRDVPVVPSTGKVVANFQSENVDIKKLFEDIGVKPAAAGTLNVKLEASGTISDLDARLDVEMRDLRSEKFPSLEPATFNLTAQSQHNQLTVSGKLQQAKIQPMEMMAKLPLDVPKIVWEQKLPDDTPVQGKIRLPRSSVNFVRQLIPAVQQVDGDAALDVDLSGTVGRPVFKGQADITLNVARTDDPTLPALQNFKGRLNFANDALNFEQFTGELSGGHFTLSGRITFPKLTTANLDLRLKADSALVARSDALTVRSDADIQFVGPINSVSVTGKVALTNSQFLKNVDLIPIGLPGRPAPEPPASHARLSFPTPPLRDWKFDVAIKTKDPVLIRGNLATGGATADLHFIGTGLRPGLQGLVRLQNVEATLPFSRLNIAYGFLYFDPSDSLNPKIDLHGTSVIRDYTIHVYIYGTSLAQQAVFNSEPPLPQEEIISLLATGTTRAELTGNNNVLAGRAAMLLVQQLYRKIFKKGQATQSNSVFNRLDIDVGTVDPRTGQQQATARFKINDQFVVVGDLGVGGGYRGMLKYLIRFD
jgi:autotransporter translocation and assembly factor TamB